jgi:excisionase family DNA binding protein
MNKWHKFNMVGDKKCQLSSQNLEGPKTLLCNFNDLDKSVRFGIENAINQCKVQWRRWKAMIRDNQDNVLTTQEACHYLRISRPTYLKYLYLGRIKGTKAGKGWKVLKSELDRFLKGENEHPQAA